MHILALETSTEYCSCALLYQQETLARAEFAPRRHAELILPMADSLLAEAGLTPQQLDAVAFGRGPGSFTGLRIACGVAQGIALAADVLVLPVSSLAALAQAVLQAGTASHVLAVLDARMAELYWGIFARNAAGLAELVGEERLSVPENLDWTLIPATAPWCATGTGWETYPAVAARLQAAQGSAPTLSYPLAQALLPLAQAAWQQGQGVPAAQALPVYLRNQVVQ